MTTEDIIARYCKKLLQTLLFRRYTLCDSLMHVINVINISVNLMSKIYKVRIANESQFSEQKTPIKIDDN